MSYTSKVWVSHSSISDFLRCPRAYYLKNIYKDPDTGNKIQITSPAFSLGVAVHEVIESLAVLKTDVRFEEPMIKIFDKVWEKVSGKKGGFLSMEIENEFKHRGEEMLERIRKNPGPLKRPAVRINMDLPSFPLTKEEDMILCGKIDWLEYIPEEDAVKVIDFKTNKDSIEDPESLQLPIYYVLAKNCQKREVIGVSYWYVNQSDHPHEQKLPDYEKSLEKIITIARRIKIARQLNSMNCPNGSKGCRDCIPYERILKGEGELVNTDKVNRKSIYILKDENPDREGTIL